MLKKADTSIMSPSATEMFARLVREHPLVLAGGIVVLIPAVVLFGMSFLLLVSAMVIPMLIPVVAIAGVRFWMMFLMRDRVSVPDACLVS